MTSATATLIALAAVTIGCYGTPKGTHSGKAGSGGAGGSGGLAGSSAGGGGAQGGTSGATGGTNIGDAGGSTAGHAGTSGGVGGTTDGSTGGSGPVFVGGPCVTSPDQTAIEVFARSSDGHIYRRAFDGVNWGTWNNLPALDSTLIDARSDLDCSASGTSVHIVATGLNPVGALLHAFGFGTSYNPFFRELTGATFGPGASIADLDDNRYVLGALGSGATLPAVYEFGEMPTPDALTPITTETDAFRSPPDIVVQPLSASRLTYFAAFDLAGALAIYTHSLSASGAHWADPIKLATPGETFDLSPTICTENGAFGVISINVAAVAGSQLWYTRSPSSTSPFSQWQMIASDVASSPDYTVVGPDSIVHVVALNASGALVDVNGKGTNWVATDLGHPR